MSATLEVAIFLSMNGKAQEAIDFYKIHFHAKESLLVTYEDMTKRDSSILLTEGNKNNIAHSVLLIGKTKVMIAEDTMDPRSKYSVGNNTSLCIQSSNLEEIEQFYSSLLTDDRVKVIVPLSANSFSKAYGIIEDPFGVHIQLMYDPRLK
ncbi:VOC family protein [Paenibacillus alvei]|uniref:VOC family protein n=1 Tax=Paenibacillus alvei TaxID=44250 RepID=UPI0013DA59E4|nr:VOC family protein [Paenibacillus alvei]MBG9734381.1 3-demethylubiquinone-9 3-methyltransferase [Paenibacillus alvei]MBG9744317.1 3-demethylubiquinone-9 3-methyltransferase [Paenibacillus alvei]MCY9577996.1 VOC family protein [Paenibacillus alvei]MCY9585290.1 VOC family protein [Paenibacillus alvei]NEZ44343.1 VOC family protein [Paenibacillus alvei]